MALALQTFSTVKDANAALKAAGTRYLGGGTLVVRAANEGDVSVSGLIRSTEPALSAITVSGREVRIGFNDVDTTEPYIDTHHVQFFDGCRSGCTFETVTRPK